MKSFSYKFTERVQDIEQLLCDELGYDCTVDKDTGVITYRQNDDKLVIYPNERTCVFTSPTPTQMFSSRLNTKRTKWVAAKGYAVLVEALPGD